jgi:hypothetical protein
MMTQEQVRNIAINIFKSTILPKMDAKGSLYAPVDAFENFKRNAELTGETPAANLMTMATKHWVWLAAWARGERPGTTKSELLERITDVVIYLFLLWAMGDQLIDGVAL